jgi:hypothetical protein
VGAGEGSIDFKLTGPGVNLETTLNDGDGSYDMLSGNFAPSSTYVAVDGNQPAVARAQFTTAASGTAAGSAGGSSSSSGSNTVGTANTGSGSTGGANVGGAVTVGTLSGTVGATGALKLTYKGKTVTTLEPGKYTVTIVDTSTHNGFLLHGSSTVTVSSIPYVGMRSLVLDLKTGRWYFAPTAKGKKTYFVVTAPAVGG